jgi:hypothetical protein
MVYDSAKKKENFIVQTVIFSAGYKNTIISFA